MNTSNNLYMFLQILIGIAMDINTHLALDPDRGHYVQSQNILNKIISLVSDMDEGIFDLYRIDRELKIDPDNRDTKLGILYLITKVAREKIEIHNFIIRTSGGLIGAYKYGSVSQLPEPYKSLRITEIKLDQLHSYLFDLKRGTGITWEYINRQAGQTQ